MKPEPKYSVIKTDAEHACTVIAKGLPLGEARALCALKEDAYRAEIKAQGKHYSSWIADLFHCQLES